MLIIPSLAEIVFFPKTFAGRGLWSLHSKLRLLAGKLFQNNQTNVAINFPYVGGRLEYA